MNRFSYYPPCSAKTLRSMYYESNMTYREISEVFGSSVKRVQTAMRYFDLKPRKAIPRNQIGENNKNWKGDKAGYAACHRRLYKNQPRFCEICQTTDESKKYHWASLTKNYHDPKDYKRMCKSCHSKFDNIITNITKGI